MLWDCWTSRPPSHSISFWRVGSETQKSRHCRHKLSWKLSRWLLKNRICCSLVKIRRQKLKHSLELRSLAWQFKSMYPSLPNLSPRPVLLWWMMVLPFLVDSSMMCVCVCVCVGGRSLSGSITVPWGLCFDVMSACMLEEDCLSGCPNYWTHHRLTVWSVWKCRAYVYSNTQTAWTWNTEEYTTYRTHTAREYKES